MTSNVFAYVIERAHGSRWDADGKEGVPHLYSSMEDAEYVLEQMRPESRIKRRVSIATPAHVEQGQFVHPKRYAKKTSCLVEIYEDVGERKFALCSRAENENEFVAEFSIAFSRLPIVEPAEQAIRVRELLPLVVDVCCKYRGYKAERVQQRIVLVAGDLEIPTLKLGSLEPTN